MRAAVVQVQANPEGLSVERLRRDLPPIEHSLETLNAPYFKEFIVDYDYDLFVRWPNFEQINCDFREVKSPFRWAGPQVCFLEIQPE
jgi:hypothetical protein